MHQFLLDELLDWLPAVLPPGGPEVARPHRPPADDQAIWEAASTAAVALGISPEQMLRRFGRHLFPRLARRFPAFFVDTDDAIAFVARLETHVLGEVRTLFPATPLPAVTVVSARPGPAIELRYDGPAALAALAEGLVLGCVAYFEDTVRVARILHDGPGTDAVRFVLEPRAARAP